MTKSDRKSRSLQDASTATSLRLGRWHTRAPTLLGHAVADWVVILVAWWVMDQSSAVLVDIAAVFVVAGRLHALGGILHDACHRPARSSQGVRWWLVEALAGWPISSTTVAMRYHHLRHHRLSNTPCDPYRRPTFCGRALPFPLLCLRGLLLPLWWTLRAPVGVLSLASPALRGTYARAFLQDRSGADLDNHPEVLRCARADVVQLLAQLSVIAIVVNWQLPFLLPLVVPLHLAGILNAARLAREHTGELHDDATHENVVAATRSNTLGPLGDWLMYPHNLGLHVEHHLYPGVGFVHLPKVRDYIEQHTGRRAAEAADTSIRV